MDEEFFDENLLLLLFLLLNFRKLRKSKCKKNIRRRPPKFWVRNIFKKREELGEYHHLIQALFTASFSLYPFAALSYSTENSFTYQKVVFPPLC